MGWEPPHRKETCHLKRQPELEQVQCLTVKTLEQVFVARALEGLGCSLFEAGALIGLVKDVHFPWFLEPEAIQAGQLAMISISAEEPGHTPVAHCKMSEGRIEPAVGTVAPENERREQAPAPG